MLNELSVVAHRPLDEDALAEIVSMFAAVIRATRSIRKDIALVTSAGLNSLMLTGSGESLTTFALRRGGRTRDEWRYIQQTRNHAPFAVAPGLRLVDASEEYRFGASTATGLGLAASNHQLAVSLVAESWPDHEIELERIWLEETDDDDLVERSERVSAAHAATPAHVEHHRQFIVELALPSPLAGEDLWGDREALYPHLRFLPRVEDQLRGFPAGGEALRQVAMRLRELESATSEWNSAAQTFPRWRSHVTPEAEQRKRLCIFTDLDGHDQCFDLHARFTPGAGRIHFRLPHGGEGRRLMVAHIGKKL